VAPTDGGVKKPSMEGTCQRLDGNGMSWEEATKGRLVGLSMGRGSPANPQARDSTVRSKRGETSALQLSFERPPKGAQLKGGGGEGLKDFLVRDRLMGAGVGRSRLVAANRGQPPLLKGTQPNSRSEGGGSGVDFAFSNNVSHSRGQIHNKGEERELEDTSRISE